MKIAELSVKNPQFTLVIVAMVAALGIHSFASMPRSEDPQFPFPAFGVIAVYPGATPKDVERLVVEPIEDALAELDDIKVMKSKIGDGVAVVQIEFEAGVDSSAKHQEVLRQVESQRKDLPEELHSLEVRQFETTNVALVQMALVAPSTPYHELERLGERLETRLESIDGIKNATVWAYPERQVRVGLDIERLAQHGVGLDQVLGAMQSDTTLIPGGHVDVGGHKLNVETTGRWKSLDDVKNTIVAGGPAGVVRLADVADVEWGYADDAHLARFDGQRAIFVTANQKAGMNVFDVQKAIDATVAEFRRELPAGVRLEQGFRQASNVAHRLDRLYVDFGLAILLVLVTLLPLGLRASLVVMISIPLSLAIGLALLHVFGYGINQLSIVGFVIALGLLVDDSIVVVENITRFLREGKSRKDAAILATKQIGAAVLGCTAALIFAFVPLLVLPGSAGDFIRSLPMAVVLTIIASLLVSLTVVPFLAASLLSAGHDPHGNLFLKGMTRAIEWTYRPILAFTLKRPAVTLVAGAALFAASLSLIPRVGFSLFPTAQTPQFLVSIETPDGSSLEHTDEVVRFVEATLAKHPEIQWTMANIGRGNPQVYYNIAGANEAANVGEVLVQVEKYDPRRTPRLLDTLRAELSGRADARIKVIEFQNGPQIDAPVAIRLKGDDLTVLTSLSRDVERILETTPGTLAVDNPLRVRRTDLRVEVDRDRAGLFGVATVHVARAVRLGLAGLTAGELRTDDGNEVDVEVTLAGQERARLAALDRLVVPSQAGGQVPLAQVTTLGLESSPTRIDHHDRQRSVSVSAQVQSGFNTDRVTRQVLAKLESLELPPGYHWEAAGEVESRQESFGGLGTAVIIAIFSILAILVLEFRSFRGTVIVASVIPLGIAGGVALLWLAGESLSFTAAVGFIALIGIEIKNSILLVDFTNQLRQEGLPLDEAIQKAGEIRFVPIVLTSLTAIGGLLPLALQGSALYSPLALVIIGGLISSTLLSRLVTPAVYKLLAPPMAPESSHA